ncbi:hypothetical protein FOZ62_012040, partial [Perkinsus olseni]
MPWNGSCRHQHRSRSEERIDGKYSKGFFHQSVKSGDLMGGLDSARDGYMNCVQIGDSVASIPLLGTAVPNSGAGIRGGTRSEAVSE